MKQAVEILAEPPLTISYLAGENDMLVISFSGVGLNEQAQAPQVESARMATFDGQNHAVFVADSSRSWMNGPQLAEAIVAAVGEVVATVKPRRIVAIGDSMGRTAALIYATLAKVDAVLAISPQYSVHPDVMPEETRWDRFTRNIQAWLFPAVPALPAQGTQFMILHGAKKIERRHADRFRPARNLDHFLFPDMGHRLALLLKQAQALDPIVRAFISGDYVSARAAAARAGGLTKSAFRTIRKAAKAAKQSEALA
jgi:acetyl esterase/lipase